MLQDCKRLRWHLIGLEYGLRANLGQNAMNVATSNTSRYNKYFQKKMIANHKTLNQNQNQSGNNIPSFARYFK